MNKVDQLIESKLNPSAGVTEGVDFRALKKTVLATFYGTPMVEVNIPELLSGFHIDIESPVRYRNLRPNQLDRLNKMTMDVNDNVNKELIQFESKIKDMVSKLVSDLEATLEIFKRDNQAVQP